MKTAMNDRKVWKLRTDKDRPGKVRQTRCYEGTSCLPESCSKSM